VSLVVADRLPAGDWCDGAAAAVLGDGPPILWLSAVAVFHPGGWVALAVTPTRHLLAAHAAAVALTAGHVENLWEHYAPDAWIPHCTLAAGVPDDAIGEAVRIAARSLPVTAAGGDASLMDGETGTARTLARA
jgi:hypothetical protein